MGTSFWSNSGTGNKETEPKTLPTRERTSPCFCRDHCSFRQEIRQPLYNQRPEKDVTLFYPPRLFARDSTEQSARALCGDRQRPHPALELLQANPGFGVMFSRYPMFFVGFVGHVSIPQGSQGISCVSKGSSLRTAQRVKPAKGALGSSHVDGRRFALQSDLS